jgi:hypothetical protein
MKELLRYL